MRHSTFPDLRRLAPRALLIALALALLAPRVAGAAVFVVTSTGDAGDAVPGNGSCAGPGGCTLRAAIEEANALPNGQAPDEIHFDIAGSGVHTISPTSPLPAVVDAVVIDALTQPGAGANTLAAGTDAVLLVELSGSTAGPTDGLVLDADASVVRGLVVNGWTRSALGQDGSGIVLRGAGGHRVEACFVGTDPTGTMPIPNAWAGIRVASEDNVVGGAEAAARNLVSGNLVAGIDVTGAGTRILGNVVGLDAAGGTAVPNERGIRVDGASAVVGGTETGAGNVLSGNVQAAVNLLGGGDGSVILGNLIGTDVGGTLDRGNGIGVRVSPGALDVHVGLAAPGGANVVSGNSSHGIQVTGGHRAVVENNVVGSDAGGTLDLGNGGAGVLVDADDVLVGGAGRNLIAFNGGDGIQLYASGNQRNTFVGNAIHSNGGLGIDIGMGGPTPNDEGDADIGGNGQQNFPILATVASNGVSTTVAGELHSTPNAFFQVDVYASVGCDPSGFGEGADYRGAIFVQTDATGVVAFSEVIPVAVPGGREVTATATDADGATSEFSPCVTATGPAVTTTTFFVTTSTTVVTTSTTTPGGSTTTTSTTLPVACTVDSDCDLDDACALGTCAGGLCEWTGATSIDGVLCHATNLRRMLDGGACAAACRCPFDARITRVERRYGQALLTARDGRCRRLAKRGRKPARKLHGLVTRRERKGCLGANGAALLQESSALRDAASVLDVRAACQR